MKKIIFLLSAVAFIISCQNQKLDSPNNHEMSGIIKGEDQYTKGIKKFMKAYVDNDMASAKDIFANDADFYINDTKLTIDDMIAGFSVGHQFFNNISHNNVDMATMYYNNESIYTNIWYDWSGEIKSSGEKLNLKGYGWFKWENGKVVEAYNAFDPTAYNAAMNRQVSDYDQSVKSLVESAKAFQNAYITNNYAVTKNYLSDNFQTSIYNSSGQPLVIQSKDEIENSGAGWNFGRFDMANFNVSFSKGKKAAVVTFDAVGTINFDKGKKNVPYSTRASQMWTNEDGNWKLMHSHWSPKSGAKGVPIE
ncbi:MAG: DUF4440 domain-containing protein [Flavobacteriaceae bacterium]